MEPTDVEFQQSEEGRGRWAKAARGLAKGHVLFREPALSLVHPGRDAPWLRQLREDLAVHDRPDTWCYVQALCTLSVEEVPQPVPAGLEPLSAAQRAQVEDLCGEAEAAGLGMTCAEHLLRAIESSGAVRPPAAAPPDAPLKDWLAGLINRLAAKVHRNAFEVLDASFTPQEVGTGLFPCVSLFNHRCVGSNCEWSFKGAERLMELRTGRAVAAGEELSLSYLSKPWCDLARNARRAYIRQHLGFDCLCPACIGDEPGREAQCELSRPSNLSSLLTRWLKDEADEEEPARVPQGDAELSQRLERLLGRCQEEECAGVTREEAERALIQEGGHVGRAMQLLRSARVGAEASECSQAKPEISDEERADRVLARCRTEALLADVKREEAHAALGATEGHVGKALIHLRKARREV